MFTLLMIGAGLIIALGMPLFMWMSYLVRRPRKNEEQIQRGVEEARRRIDKLPH